MLTTGQQGKENPGIKKKKKMIPNKCPAWREGDQGKLIS